MISRTRCFAATGNAATSPTALRTLSISLIAGAVLTSISALPAHANDVDVTVHFTEAPTIYVEAKDGAYAQLSPEKHNGQNLRFAANIEILGGQDRIRRWHIAPRMKALGQTWGWGLNPDFPLGREAMSGRFGM
jgi:hypothetical protein